MGGTSTSNTAQQSSSSPWDTGQSVVNSIVPPLQTMIANSGLNPTQTGALNSIEANAAAGNPYASGIQGLTSNLLSGGGATDQSGNVNQNYQNYFNNTQPLASNVNYNPYSTPGFSDAINTATSDITNNTNGLFAAAGRDMSPANTQALSRGLASGLAPIIQSQYNQNVQNQQGAAGNLYAAGNTNAGILSGMQQQGLVNAQGGAQMAPTALDANNYQANTDLQAEAQRTGIPIQTLGLLSQIGIPIAGLGTNSTGTGNTTSNMSGAQQFGLISGGIGNLAKVGAMF